MNIGIIGLGLMGGSFAKAIKRYTDHIVYGQDISQEVVYKAISENAIDNVLSVDNIGSCDLIIVALYPDEAIKYVKAVAPFINTKSIVIDCVGVKRRVCEGILPIAEKYGFEFIGTHPMAGIEFSGYDKSKEDMFINASMIMVINENNNKKSCSILEEFFIELGFNNIKYATPEEHDSMIAYTSQLAHVVSSAYVKSPSALKHKGFSAGSFKDMTRVAYLNEDMWTQLFLENADNLSLEVENIIERLKEYHDAIKKGDSNELRILLKKGKECKILSENLNDEDINS